MANPYFNFTNPVAPGAPILSNKYNGDFRAVERAFDILPAPNELIASYKNFGVTAGSPTAYTLTLASFDASFGYAIGMQVVVKMHVSNSGPATISLNGLTPVPIVNLVGGLGPLVANDMRQNAIYSLRYDGANFQLVNASSNLVEASKTAATNAKSAMDTAQSLLSTVTSAYTNLLNGPLRVGAIKFYATGTNPNTLYPGTTWTQLTGTSSVAKGWRRTA